jgi:acetylornithine/succinyldiaminopimelate/putrescine aminotransferase
VTAAAGAVLDVVDDPDFLADVTRKGELLRDGLSALGLDARGRGLMLAFRTPDGPGFVRRALLEERLVLNAPAADAVRLLPPLTVSDEEIEEALRRIDRVAAG